ncbi:endonuclease/exonuclease/phosphatase family protein [Opitutus sp. ER46]|uniref:endonuclease/exonuclease/phosphatase family protein n=1 Tax=Opitutus sp. ER46 TaxID=2161864 RepID=UPI000D31C0E5|nr:endonuclease/exonuclease/phosphatase family protein [Opitutus sp. ER46]PTX94647.1 endonuclease [Opitutus sp. ER46]
MRSFYLVLLCLAALGSARAFAAPATIRVLTYNIHHGEGLDHAVDLPRIAEIIRTTGADVVALQEVDRGVRRTAGRDLSAELAALTGMKVAFGPNLAFQGGDYGNAVLSRFPIRAQRNTRFAHASAGEPRGVLQVELEVQGRRVLFLSTHLDVADNDAERVRAVAELRRIVTAEPGLPVVLGGDFNDVPASRTHGALSTFLSDVWPQVGTGPGYTFPTSKPVRRIDSIWITAPTLGAVSAQVVAAPVASDHLPLLAEIRFR